MKLEDALALDEIKLNELAHFERLLEVFRKIFSLFHFLFYKSISFIYTLVRPANE